MKVIKDYIQVKEPLEEEKKTEAGLILATDTVDYSKPVTAEVVAAGKDVEEVKVGDKVMYMPRIGTPIKQEDCILRVFKEEQVLAIL